MARAITGDELRQAVENQTFIKQGSVRCAEGIKYDFRLGSRILKASFGQPINLDQLSEVERGKLAVEPGEIVFVLTEERLELPGNMMVELSPKRKVSHEGVIVLGGFCVDPLYRGRLIVGLYNYSSTPFPIISGRKLIGAVFFELQGGEVRDFPTPEPLEDFPEGLIRLIQNYKPLAFQGLQQAFAELHREVADLRNEFVSGREWQRQFQTSLEHHDRQIGDLITGLATESGTRERGEDRLSTTLVKIEKTLVFLKGAAWVVGGALTLIGIPLLVAWLLKLFKLS